MTHQERCKHGCRNEPVEGCDLPACLHADIDQLGPVCLHCFRIKWPRPEAVVIVGAILFFSVHFAAWVMGGFSVVK